MPFANRGLIKFDLQRKNVKTIADDATRSHSLCYKDSASLRRKRASIFVLNSNAAINISHRNNGKDHRLCAANRFGLAIRSNDDYFPHFHFGDSSSRLYRFSATAAGFSWHQSARVVHMACIRCAHPSYSRSRLPVQLLFYLHNDFASLGEFVHPQHLKPFCVILRLYRKFMDYSLTA